MSGTHRKRIEFLELRFDQLETGLAGVRDHVAQIDQNMERILRRLPRRPTTRGNSLKKKLIQRVQKIGLREIPEDFVGQTIEEGETQNILPHFRWD